MRDTTQNNIAYVDYMEASQAMDEGHPIRNIAWMNGKFAYKQIPNDVTIDIVPQMNSVPEAVKEHIQKSDIQSLRFRNQINVVSASGIVTSWRFDGDVDAEVWEIL